MGKSLTLSKAEPFVIHPLISKIYIFREKEALPLPKTTYITLPEWLQSIKPEVLSRFLRIIVEPLQLIYYAAKIKPDIINGYHLIPKGINSLIAARLTGSKSILSLMGGIIEIDTYSRLRWFLKRLNLWALRETDLITTKGSVVNSYLKEHNIPSSKVLVYNGAVNLRKFYFDSSIKKKYDVLFAGTFRNLKGPDRVLRILAILKKDFPSIKACFIGTGYLSQTCVELSEQLGIYGNVLFTGYVEDPSFYFQQSKILAMPSRSEGLPTSMLEAMACGCVPVVSNVGNIKDTAIHNDNAFLVNDYRDIYAFTKYIHRLLSDENLRAGMAMRGIQTVKENYSADHQSKIVDQMIKKVFSKNGTK